MVQLRLTWKSESARSRVRGAGASLGLWGFGAFRELSDVFTLLLAELCCGRGSGRPFSWLPMEPGPCEPDPGPCDDEISRVAGGSCEPW